MIKEVTCQFPLCSRHPKGNGYCISHQMYASMTMVKAPKKVNKVSDTRKEDQKKYLAIVKEMMAVSNKCEIKAEGCGKIATGLHHKQKRSPSNLLDRNNLIRACDSCNGWIELHPTEAMEKGFSISKHQPVEN